MVSSGVTSLNGNNKFFVVRIEFNQLAAGHGPILKDNRDTVIAFTAVSGYDLEIIIAAWRGHDCLSGNIGAGIVVRGSGNRDHAGPCSFSLADSQRRIAIGHCCDNGVGGGCPVVKGNSQGAVACCTPGAPRHIHTVRHILTVYVTATSLEHDDDIVGISARGIRGKGHVVVRSKRVHCRGCLYSRSVTRCDAWGRDFTGAVICTVFNSGNRTVIACKRIVISIFHIVVYRFDNRIGIGIAAIDADGQDTVAVNRCSNCCYVGICAAVINKNDGNIQAAVIAGSCREFDTIMGDSAIIVSCRCIGTARRNSTVAAGEEL